MASSIFLAISSFTPADCKNSLKNQCKSRLNPFVHNGQFNTLNLQAGEQISTYMSFYQGHTYRIVTCQNNPSEEAFYFEVKTTEDQLLYSSKGKANYWDFKSEITTNLKIEVHAAGDPSNESASCVGVIIGFQE